MHPSSRTPEEFLNTLPEPAQTDIRRLDAAITAVMTGHERYLIEGKFWGGSDQEIIAYGHYTHTNRSGNAVQWHIVGLALQKNAISVYVNAVKDNRYLAEHYGERLGKVRTAKSVVSFRKLADVDLDVLLEMIGRARDIMTGNDPGS